MTDPATAPEVKDAVSQVRNRRTDAMFVAAYIAVMAMIWVVVYEPNISEYSQGVITLAIGNFIGYLTAMYNFETGTTRSTAKKDDTIVALTKAAESTALGPSASPAPMKVETVNMDAKDVVVNPSPKEAIP